MRRLRYFVGFVALDLIMKQVQLAEDLIERELLGDPRHACTRSFLGQYGLPCKHTIAGLIRVNSQLVLGHVNKHWYLKEAVCSFIHQNFRALFY